MSMPGVGAFPVIIALAALCSFALGSSAIASPAVGRPGSLLSTINSARPQSTVRRSLDLRKPRFDLRPTTNVPSMDARGDSSAHAPATPVPSIRHFGLDDRRQLAALGTVDESFRVVNQPEAFVRRVHQEGLPVARLWETKSSLLSIGLNQKGKPGLWLIQKTH
jgi:hypothetical protein